MVKQKKKPRITSLDSRLFADLHKAKRPLSIQRLAKRTDTSWKTVRDHVKDLEKMGVLRTKKTIRKTNVFIDENILKDLIRRGKLKK